MSKANELPAQVSGWFLILRVWFGPNEIETRSFTVLADDWFEALDIAVRWALVRRKDGTKAKSVTSYQVSQLAIAQSSG